MSYENQTAPSAARRFDFDPSWSHRALYHKFTHIGDDWDAVAAKVQLGAFLSLLKLIRELPSAVEHVYPLWEAAMPALAAYADTIIDADLERSQKSKKSLERHLALQDAKRSIALYHQLSAPSAAPQNVTEAVTWSGDKPSISLQKLRKPQARSAPVANQSVLLDYVDYMEGYSRAEGIAAFSSSDAAKPSVKCPPLCRCIDCVGYQLATHRGRIPVPHGNQEYITTSLDEVRCTVGLGWMKPHSAPVEKAPTEDDPLESYLAIPDILTNVLSFKYCFGAGQDLMTNDFTIGLLKWLDHSLELYCKYHPDIPWFEFWKDCYETLIMFLMSMEANNRMLEELNILRILFADYPIEYFRRELFPQLLVKAGMDYREWTRLREIYLPDITNFQYRPWFPQKESLWVPRQNYDVFKYNQFTLTGVTPVELWSAWCCGLWGQTSVCEHELMRFKLSKPGTFSFKCPLRKKIIEIIAFGVLKKKVHPQLIVDYLQAVMLINMQPDLLFVARMWSPIVEDLYQRDFVENKYGLTDEELLSVHEFGKNVLREETSMST